MIDNLIGLEYLKISPTDIFYIESGGSWPEPDIIHLPDIRPNPTGNVNRHNLSAVPWPPASHATYISW